MPGADDREAWQNAVRRNPKNVQYHDYKTKADFSLWLAGYREKIRNAFGFTSAQDVEVNAEVLRSISGRLETGTALDAYNCLPDTVKANYTQLVEHLTAEFIDPQKQRRFLEDYSYNKRSKGQSLKDFMQEIKKDQNQYSGLKDEIEVGGVKVPNATKVHDGIRRFKKGIRNRKGKKDKDQTRHLHYNLHTSEDLTWDKALDVASRWEAANDFRNDSSSSSSSTSAKSSSDDELLEAVKSRKVKKDKRKKKDGKGSESEALTENDMGAAATFATLADRVEANEKGLEELKDGQIQLSENLAAWRDEMNSAMDQIMRALGVDQEN